MSIATIATIDWRRVSLRLGQAVRNNGGGNVDQAIELVKGILRQSGSESHTNKMVGRLGLLCLHGKPNVIAPACPDLPHNGQVYTFHGKLGSGVSLLAMRHIDFLCLLQGFLGEITILYADREALDPYMQRTYADYDEFMERMRRSVDATKKLVANRGLSARVMMMSELFPNLGDQEETSIQHLLVTEMSQLRSMTNSRMDMYWHMGFHHTQITDELILRTARTTAQYSALGTLATQQNLAVVNHTTVNLRRFTDVGTALVHNPVKVY